MSSRLTSASSFSSHYLQHNIHGYYHSEFNDNTDCLLVNTERGWRKEKNVRNNLRVAISMTDPDNLDPMLSASSEIDEVTTVGAREHIDGMAKRYTGEDEYQTRFRPNAS